MLICSPNPFTSSVELQFEKIPEGKAQLSVIDVSGRKVIDKQLIVNSELPNLISISDMAVLTKGFYVVQISTSQKIVKTTVIKID
jgi:hypothetical protein